MLVERDTESGRDRKRQIQKDRHKERMIYSFYNRFPVNDVDDDDAAAAANNEYEDLFFNLRSGSAILSS